MQKKPSEWVSISDLMSGVMAVVMLLLVISVLQNTYAELKHKKELEASQNGKQQKVAELINQMKSSISSSAGSENLISFNLEQSKITLKDNVFKRGSACITPEARQALAKIQDNTSNFLSSSPYSVIFVEGHTDNLPVSKPVIDIEKFCTVYDDNYTLSAARAREARKLLIGDLDLTSAKRIIVAGYGDSQPISGISPSHASNRRVDVRFDVQN